MRTINRSVAIIRPQQPFIDWANRLPDTEREVTADDFTDDCTVVLIPEYDTDEQAKESINDFWQDIFEGELFDWCTNEDWWPTARTSALFWQWFDLEPHSVVMDPYDDPIEKEE